MLIATARWVLPNSSAAIVNGEVEVIGSKITYCGPRRPPSNETKHAIVRDFGNAILMPGFVNAHTHVEYTMLRGFLEDIDFFPWIRSLTAAKANFDRNDWLISGRLGALECIESGITTIGDNSDAGVTAQIASEYSIRAIVYQEVFGIDNREPWKPVIAELDSKLLANSQHASETVQLGVSPHAIYTVRPDLMRELVRYCDSNKLRTSIHIAESLAESDLCYRGTGPFAEMYKHRGITWDSPKCSPTQYAYNIGALNSATLAVHCVQQDHPDIELMAKSGASLAHCAKSNAKLGAGIAPLVNQLEKEGLSKRIGLGTDSAVSNNTHDLFEEMRFALFTQRAANRAVELSAHQMFACATEGGARALALGHKIGTLEAGKQADIIAVSLNNNHSSPATDPYSALVYSSRADDVCFTMVDGRILYDNHAHTTVDTETVRKQASVSRQKALTQ